MRTKLILFISVIIVSLSGCGNSALYSGDVYRAGQAGTVQSVTYGTIVSVRNVSVQVNENSSGAIGTVSGAALGGIAGNSIGNGSGQVLATAAGAILGGVLGEKVENSLSRSSGVELEIRLDSGSTIAVVQTIHNTQFSAGQRVRIVGTGSNATVSPL